MGPELRVRPLSILLKWDRHIKLITFAVLNQAVFDHFGTFPVGWVVGSIKIKDHLSPAEAEIRAELGNHESEKQFVQNAENLAIFKENDKRI